jgi:Fe-S oxidoreductase
VPSPRALAWLAWRALVVQPLKRLAHRGTGLERFRAAYAGDGLRPTLPEERAVALLASRCVGCGLCEARCPLPDPPLAALGLPAAFRLVGRRAGDLALAAPLLEACAGCRDCEPACPTAVPIGRVVAHLRVRAAPGTA